jgi:hypothetical protein
LRECRRLVAHGGTFSRTFVVQANAKAACDGYVRGTSFSLLQLPERRNGKTDI